jgi:hypothetical protein
MSVSYFRQAASRLHWVLCAATSRAKNSSFFRIARRVSADGCSAA